MLFRKEIGESLTITFAESAARRKQQGLPIVSLGLGEPEFKTPHEIIEATVEILRSGNSGYSSPTGILSLRQKIAKKLFEENCINCDAENIIITAGAKQAFQLVSMALLEPNDEVIVVNPSYVSFIPQLYISEPRCKVITVDISKDSFEFPIDLIKEKITPRTKILVINSPNNPTGYVISKEILKKLFKLAVESDFFIISDEIYEKLIFCKTPHFSIGTFEEVVERVITINGFSKSHAMTGWRLGYACFPQKIKPKLIKLQQHSNTNTCTFIQKAVDKSFYINYTYLCEYNERMRTRIEMYKNMISELKNVTGILPSGGFFAFMNISKLGMDSNSFCRRLIEETGVAITPGIAFGENWDDHVRISFATTEDILEHGLKLISGFIKNI